LRREIGIVDRSAEMEAGRGTAEQECCGPHQGRKQLGHYRSPLRFLIQRMAKSLLLLLNDRVLGGAAPELHKVALQADRSATSLFPPGG
jgi:hypothetical protein